MNFSVTPLWFEKIKKQKNFNVLAAIPTYDSFSYITKTLEKLLDEIKESPDHITIKVAICLNGENSEKSEEVIQDFIKNNPAVSIKLLIKKEKGKNKSMNTLAEYARSHNFDIIHFIDDDIHFKKGSMQSLIKNLIKNQKKHPVPVMAGSQFEAVHYSFSHFYGRKKNIFKAFKFWFIHNILIIPFSKHAERPKFCSGNSMGAFVAFFPVIPDDSAYIADDAFLSQYYVYRNKEYIRATQFNPIIKPDDSIVYFKVAESLKEWWSQQKRTGILVSNSYHNFEDEIGFLFDFFRWPYAFKKGYRKSEKLKSFKQAFFYYIHRAIYLPMAFFALKHMEKRKEIGWNTAASTKNI